MTSAPERWVISDDVREVVRSAGVDDPDPDRLRRLEARVRGRLGGAVPPPAGPVSGGLRVLVVMATVAAALALWWGWRHAPETSMRIVSAAERSPPPAHARAVRAVVLARAVEPHAPSRAAPSRAAPSRAAPSRAAGPSPRPDAIDTLAEEVRLLERARRALAGSPADALALTDEHGRRFRRGVLVEEREVLAVEALASLARGHDAEVRAARFQRWFPASSHGPRIARALGERLQNRGP